MAMPVKHELTPEELFCLEGCRSYEQYCHMRKQFENEVCPFCNLDRTLNEVVFKDKNVICFMPPSGYKRKELKHHFIIIPIKHGRYETQIGGNEVFLSIFSALGYLYGRYSLEGGVFVARFGDMRLNAGTVPHLHYNIMVPNGTGEVKISVFKDPKDRAKNQERAEEFARRYEAGEVPD